jgi:hypothetical protein
MQTLMCIRLAKTHSLGEAIMKPLEHHDEVSALCAIFALVASVDWVAWTLADLLMAWGG